MVKLITIALMKYLDIDALCTIMAKAISFMVAYASRKGGKTWDATKSIIAKVNVWTSLFMQVYEDDTMTQEEEQIIAEAIKKETNIEKLIDILKKDAEKQQT